jgi:hypothetical protein
VLQPLDVAQLFAPLLVVMAGMFRVLTVARLRLSASAALVEMKQCCYHGNLLVAAAGIWAFVILVRYTMLIIIGTCK